VLSAQERAYLERQVRRHRVARSLSERCRVILRCADGLASKSVGAELGLHEHTVGKWRRRFLKDRCDGLLDEARPGRPRTIDDDQVAAVIERTLRTTPADATRSIPFDGGETAFRYDDPPYVGGVGLQPHRSQISNCRPITVRRQGARHRRPLPLAAQPGAAVIALTRKTDQGARSEQPVLPMIPGVLSAERQLRAARHTSLFQRSISHQVSSRQECYKRHRAAEVLNFLKQIDARVAEGLEVHIVMDNYATHKTPKIKAWLARRPHYHVHYTPTSASWINQVERWFAELTRKRLRRGVHTSVKQLEADIRTFIDRHNENPKPFKWVKSADQILASVKRF
jgi:transposase